MGLFHARDVELKLAESVTITGSAALDTFFGSGVTVVTAKSVELDEGEQQFEQQNYHGERADGFQNQLKVRSPKGPATLSITVDSDNLRVLQGLLYDSTTNIGATHTRLRTGNAARKEVAVLVNFDDGVDECSYVLDKAEQVAPATRTTGEDGVVEYDLELKCLAKDFYGPEWKGQ